MRHLGLAFFIFAPLSICQKTTTITLASSANPALFGRTLTLSASVIPQQATGRVTFYDGTTVLGAANASNGAATLTTILPSSGVRSLNARFAGNAAYSSSSSAVLVETVKVAAVDTFQSPVGYSSSAIASLATADFDGDGHLDIVTSNYGVFMGKGDGTFQRPAIYSTHFNSTSVVTGDFNGDGKPDFATATFGGNVAVWLNNGDGTFGLPSFFAIGFGPNSLAAGDFNNDGIADLAFTSSYASGQPTGVGVLLGLGDGSFRAPVIYLTGLNSSTLAIADFNGDGNADIVSLSSYNFDQPVTILLGAGDGTFHSTAIYLFGLFPASVAIGDFNRDGKPDFVVSTSIPGNSVYVFLGNGDGTFHQQLLLQSVTCGSIAIGDFDGDGNPDVACGAADPALIVMLGKGDGTFGSPVTFPGSGPYPYPFVADFSEDGRTDLALATSFGVQILLSGSGDFPVVTTASLPDATGGVPYSTMLAAKGGTMPYTWSLSAGTLPVALSPSGTIGGTPEPSSYTATDMFSVTVSGPNGPGFSSGKTFSLKIAASFQIDPSAISVGNVGSPYSASLPATGGTIPYRNWAVVAGSLPPGLLLSPASGSLSGTPTKAGSFPFTVTVNDSAGLTSLPAKLSILILDPAPQILGVVNAASSGQATPSVVSPGSYVSIYGSGLPDKGNALANSLPLPITLNNTQVTLGGLAMPLLYAAGRQLNGLVPQALVPNKSYPLVISNGGGSSIPLSVAVTELQPGIYTVDSSGFGAGLIANALTGQLISTSNPAHPSDYIVVYCTGLGSLQGLHGETEPADGSAAPTNLTFHTAAGVTATIGGLSAPVLFSGLTPTFAGLYQVNLQVPTGLTPGSALSVVIQVTDSLTGATAKSNVVTIAVQ